jgi:hypothetical protein
MVSKLVGTEYRFQNFLYAGHIYQIVSLQNPIKKDCKLPLNLLENGIQKSISLGLFCYSLGRNIS